MNIGDRVRFKGETKVIERSCPECGKRHIISIRLADKLPDYCCAGCSFPIDLSYRLEEVVRADELL